MLLRLCVLSDKYENDFMGSTMFSYFQNTPYTLSFKFFKSSHEKFEFELGNWKWKNKDFVNLGPEIPTFKNSVFYLNDYEDLKS